MEEELVVIGPNAKPTEICGHTVGKLSMIWDEFAERTGTGKGDFLPQIFKRIWDDDDTGEKFEEELGRWNEQPEDMQPFGLIQAMLVSCAYASQGMKAVLAKDDLRAWNCAVRARYWLGIVVGSWSIIAERNNKPTMAKLGADARHAENRLIKQDVLKWLDENKDLNLNGDATAGEIAGVVAPIKWRTAREYITEWKKLRSTGTP